MVDLNIQSATKALEINRIVEANLREMADLLEQQQADGFRVSAYRRAADTISEMRQPLARILDETGIQGLIKLPAIGASIASAISEMLHTGHWAQLERLRGTTDAEKLFCTVPGIGTQLAAKLHADLHIDTLEALEAAAHDGRLGRVPGFGPSRIATIKAVLQERLGRRRIRSGTPAKVPSVALVLDVDSEYRQRAAKGDLRMIAPRRFNPEGRAWLPVLHTRREDWEFSALFSNTQRAHELDKTNDWVLIYFHTDSTVEGQCTAVTETYGPLQGQRVVRGREKECMIHYERSAAA